MNSVHNIFIVDDHQIFREALSSVIFLTNNFKVSGEAENGEAFLKVMDSHYSDIILMDINMPGIDGISTSIKALEKYPDMKIIALTTFCDEIRYYNMIRSGISGCILKESGSDELARALITVISGRKYFPSGLLSHIISSSEAYNHTLNRLLKYDEAFSEMEKEILSMVCKGYSNSIISEKLSISQRELNICKTDLMNRTGSKNLTRLVVFAIKNNLVEV